MDIQKKRDFLTNFAYWAIVVSGVYLALEYLLPISVPFIFGILIAWLVIWLTEKLHCSHRLLRIGLTLLIYGVIGFLIGLLSVKGASALSGVVKWLPEVYEKKLLPFATTTYQWFAESIRLLDPALISALEVVLESVLSALKTLVTSLSGLTVNLISSIATGIPNLILSLLAMLFSTIFVVSDYEKISGFAAKHIPG